MILLAWRAHPRYPLVVAANRDEFHSRATAPAAFWRDAPGVLAGRDLASGGTWLGVSRNGRFAAVTNYRDFDAPVPDAAPSRGALVADYLAGDVAPAAWTHAVAARGSRYRGFNLLSAGAGELWWVSNRDGGGRRLEPGLYGLSNHLLDTPWPKVVLGKARFADVLARGPSLAPLLDLLADTTLHDPPDPGGVHAARERMLSAARIVSPEYGTRCSSALLVDAAGRTRFAERSWTPSGSAAETVEFEFARAA